MQTQNNFLSDRAYLREQRSVFTELIELVQKTYPPTLLSVDDASVIGEISKAFFEEFNGSKDDEQRHLLANVEEMPRLWTYLSSNPTCYTCQNFIKELIQLASRSTPVKQHLGKHQ